ncbi:caspase recruitment domain-containing protein 17-like [Trichechus manatus latirostris]|uniref:Caspase recruitment domain-containing protein 17-like n=1 Tax=Trichechus manatus latirostris TaxID=127582 RepID=A0A2Y9QJM1_TRIMA|nr:caspase recruitment domain-containing protein 17-like [Trichechus manatus latirostris]
MEADKVLLEKRKLFIHAVNEGTINGLLDELLEKKVLNQEEMEIIRRENATDMKKARALIDPVIRKGRRACEICISHICEADPFLAEKMGLCSGLQSGNDFNAQDLPAVAPFLPGNGVFRGRIFFAPQLP